jgi:hypothetical protein
VNGRLPSFLVPGFDVSILRALRRQGAWEVIWDELRVAQRERVGREASPSASVIDSQSLKSAKKGLREKPSRRSGL